MAFTIAVAGKGGTGKTTTIGLIIRYLLEKEVLTQYRVENSYYHTSPEVTIHSHLRAYDFTGFASLRDFHTILSKFKKSIIPSWRLMLTPMPT